MLTNDEAKTVAELEALRNRTTDNDTDAFTIKAALKIIDRLSQPGAMVGERGGWSHARHSDPPGTVHEHLRGKR